ncbi:hypothetical protein Lalb_Chr03g0038231 [Lupinus albus]|uniref:Uncharacterized protein n=1 Tax=Lupinus albus TaxID=3870 RepID=A0A6A4QUF5_LUPAL|nr:hypothetical protein Lalb_Chr03g0038231 [Lupinus albus]
MLVSSLTSFSLFPSFLPSFLFLSSFFFFPSFFLFFFLLFFLSAAAFSFPFFSF